MVTLLLIIAVVVLCFTHYSAFAYGQRRMDRHIFYRYYRPLARRHVRVVDRFNEAILDDTATAQQRNVKLIAQNAILRGKAIGYALDYRNATRHLRRKPFSHRLAWMVTAIAEAQGDLDRLRRK